MFKFIKAEVSSDRENIFIFNIPIFYKRRLETKIKYRFLCFRWEVNVSYEELQLKKIYNKLEAIENKISDKKNNKILGKQFPFENVQKNSVLLVETNNFHSELLPGIARYFIDLGYNVDILISYYENKLLPFCRYTYKKIRIKSIENFNTQQLLAEEEVSQYCFVYFNSDKVNFQKDLSINYFQKTNCKEKQKIFMLHHPDEVYYKGDGTLCMLGDFDYASDKKPLIVTPTYYGNISVNPKNEKTSFLVVGNIDRKRKNFEMLIRAVSCLIDQNIKNFQVSVIARVGEISIPEKVKNYINFKGKLSYQEMYEEIERSDFLLTLMDIEIDEHKRYINKGISGTLLLSWGFRKPCLIEEDFSYRYKFNQNNSIMYSREKGFIEALQKAINLSSIDYLKMQLELAETAIKIANNSRENLKKLIPNIRK